MPCDYQAHNRRMVKRFLWLERIAPEYAEAEINAYARDPNSPNPAILADVTAERVRRALLPSSVPDSPSK